MRSLVTTLLLCLTGGLLFAQHNPQPHFRNYSTEQGLPSPATFFTMQDSRGYMWFGTINGATRFDGYHFKTYGIKEGLTSTVVFDIYEDAKGRIWFGTMTGEAFILEGDTIVPYRYNHLVQRYQGQFSIASLVYLQPGSETAYFELELVGFLKIDSTGREELITAERSNSGFTLEIEGYEQGLRTRIGMRDQEIRNLFWLNHGQNNSVFYFESILQKQRYKMELPTCDSPYCTSAFEAQRLSSGNWLVMNCRYLFYQKEDEILWAIPFTFNANVIAEDKNQAIWFCGKERRGLRRYAGLDAVRKDQYSVFLEGLSISNIYFDKRRSKNNCRV